MSLSTRFLLLGVVLLLGVLYALPNLYAPDAAVQVSTVESGEPLDFETADRIKAALQRADIPHQEPHQREQVLVVRFPDRALQLQAREEIAKELGPDYVVALYLAPTVPVWLKVLGARPMNLGLDLSGGVHFLLEVDVAAVLATQLDGYAAELRSALRKERLRARVVAERRHVDIQLRNVEDGPALRTLLTEQFAALQVLPAEQEGVLRLRISEQEEQELGDRSVTQNLQTLRNRVNELGIAEPLVQREGARRIVVELPGVQDTARAKRILGKTANLEFRMEATPDLPLLERQRFPFRGQDESPGVWLQRSLILAGDRVSDAQASFDENGRPQVNISLDATGGRLMNQVSSRNVGRNMGVLFLERRQRVINEDNGEQRRESYEQRSIISLATIQEPLGRRFRITNLGSPAASSELALLLRAGALAAPLEFVEERVVGPSLGADNIERGMRALIIGLLLVLLFIFQYYRAFGLAANFALLSNLVLLAALLSLLSATLTLPGIAGIVLTMGMAVDANVLIFARIREERRNGLTPRAAVRAGYRRAMVTIVDANLTTLLAAGILYGIGSGPIRGFAITLSLGIISSMFTAVVLTRALVEWMLPWASRPNSRFASI